MWDREEDVRNVKEVYKMMRKSNEKAIKKMETIQYKWGCNNMYEGYNLDKNESQGEPDDIDS